MRAVAARWWATAHRARSEERSRAELGMPGPSNRQVKQEKRIPLADSRKYAVSSVRVRRTPTPSASNWPRYLPRKLVGGGGSGVAVGATYKAVHATLRPELVAQADACAVLRTWFSRRGRPRGETSREHSRQGPQGVPRDHTAFSISSGFRAACSPLGARCTRHTVSPETLPCPSIVKCDLVCKCHLRTAVHL